MAEKDKRVATVNRQHPTRHDLQRRLALEPAAVQATYHLRCETCDEEFSVTGIFTSFQRLINEVLHQHKRKCQHCTSPRIILNHQT